MRTIYQISILAVLVLCIACSSVNSNPSGGARELCQELLTYAKNNNYEDASKRMEQYYNAYNDKDKKGFFMVLSVLLSDKAEHKPILSFLKNADKSKYPIFREYIINFLAWNMAFKDMMENDTSRNAGLGKMK